MKKLFLLLLTTSTFISGYHIGLCIMATGKYLAYAEQLIRSARNNFFTTDTVTYFVFTDGTLHAPAQDIVVIPQQRLGWPHDTLMRFEVYARSAERFSGIDYLFASDADMLFVAPVGREILSDRVATQHPGFVGKRGTYETNPVSTACVRKHEGTHYFAGGFYGGSRAEFLRMATAITERIHKDLEKNFIAVWHDESQLNRYFIDYRPTLILNPSYCYPERWNLPYERRLLALDKNHQELRK